MRTIGIFTVDPWTLLDENSMKSELLYFDHLKFFFRGKNTLEKLCNAFPGGKEKFDNYLIEIEKLENAGLISEFSAAEFETAIRNLVMKKLIDTHKRD